MSLWYCLDCARVRDLNERGLCDVCNSSGVCAAEREAKFIQDTPQSFSSFYACVVFLYYLIIAGATKRPDKREAKQ